MTEQQLRQRVAEIMLGWVGAYRGDSKHLEILRIYNSHKPLARSYTVQVGDAYCATTASAAYIAAGIAGYTGTECGVDPFVQIAQKKGYWVEDDAYVPKVGDACVYDWGDSGSGNNLGYPDHIGIVTRSSNGTFDVVEGNMSGGRVGVRTMLVDGKYIRGFIAPDFKKIAALISGGEEDEMTKEEVTKLVQDEIKKIQFPAVTKADVISATNDKWVETFADLPNWAKPEIRELIELGALKGTKPAETVEDVTIAGTVNNLIRPMIIAYRAVKAAAGDAPKEVLADMLKRVLAGIYAED